ncbi:MAG: M12 family metallo-peptidase [Proteobacteria bacterium]|nr:M12 family metallo-peptidase [Pseudomonadota bacterium]
MIDMELDIIQIVDNTNIALTNSETQTRIARLHVAKLNDFTHQGSFSLTLRALKDLSSLQTLRTDVGADIVTLIIEDAPASIFGVCGVAYSQTVENSNWTVGKAFNAWAYSIVQQQCVIYDNTFAHEIGHLMGTHHVRGEDHVDQENNIINNGYPYAFGWKDENFKTIMSVEPLTPSRRLYFSNPEVEVDGVFIGNVTDADNARVIDELSPAMALFQQRPDVIFVNGFE